MKKKFLSSGISVLFILIYLVSNIGVYRSTMKTSMVYFIIFLFPYIISNGIAAVLMTMAMFKKPKDIDDGNGIFIISLLAANLPFIVGYTNRLLAADVDLPLAFVGSILNVIILPFYIASILDLGKNFTILPEAHKLKTTGVYAISRHPLYSCYIYWYVVQNLICQTWIIAVISIVQISFQIIRAKREERILAANFPEYQEYRKKVWWFGRNIFYKKTSNEAVIS